MFDYITCNKRLPARHESYIRQEALFQSKSFGTWHNSKEYECGVIVIESDGRLIHNGKLLKFTGDASFYGNGEKIGWCEFTCEIVNGIVKVIHPVKLPKKFRK